MDNHIKYLLPALKHDKASLHSDLDWNKIEINPEDIEISKGSSGVYDVSYFPTPWARLYMVEYAFKKIASSKSEATLTAEEIRLINWTLDLLEIIFFKNIYNIELVFEDVGQIREDNYFEKARKLFWEYDLPILIKEKLPNATYRVLGSTSPFSLVFPAYHRIKHSYPMGAERNLFDPNCNRVTLEERPRQFIDYLIYLSKGLRAEPLSPFKTFLLNNFQNKLLNANFSSEVETVEYTSSEGATKIASVFNEAQNADLLCLKKESFKLESDFQIIAQDENFGETIFISEKLLDKSTIFSNNAVKLSTDKSTLLSHRRDLLPGTIIRYNWISEFDIFSEKLIKLPYKIDSANYQIGISDNNQASRKDEYLLPLSDKYFSICGFADDLTHDISYSYDLIEAYGKLTASVKIPLKGHRDGYLIRKEYGSSSNNIVELDGNDNLWYVSVFPNFIVSGPLDNSVGTIDYFIDQFTEGGKPSFPINTELEFYKGSYTKINKLEVKSSSVRLKNKNHQSYDSLTNYMVSEAPRLIRYKLNLGFPPKPTIGFLIPAFKQKDILIDSNYPCGIAIDFGTSNSVVAIKKKDEDEPKLLNFENLKELVTIDKALISHNKAAILSYQDYSSKYFYNGQNISNPLRSLISYSKSSTEYQPYVDFNVFCNKDNLDIDSDLNKLTSEFKWKINNPDITNLAVPWVKSYIYNLLLLTKYELISIGDRVDYRNISLTWFYPLSFNQHQKITIRSIWPMVAKKVFPNIKCDAQGNDESIAPFFDSSFASAQIPIMNIDIGGGTTDICIMNGKKQIVKLSLPLAARNLIGDLYSKKDVPTYINGIVKRQIGEISHKKNGAHEGFILALQQLASKLESNEYIIETFKESSIVVWFFYYSILKYVKNVIETFYSAENSLSVYPHIIRFSGNGSRLIEALLHSETGRNVYEELERGDHSLNILTKKVFDVERNVGIEFNSNPKAATVLGVFKMPKDIESNSNTYAILGENISNYTFKTKLSEITISSSIPEISNSYVLNEFLPEFKEFMSSNIPTFATLSSKKQIELMDKFINKTTSSGNATAVLKYIQGGILDNGLIDAQVESSLLPYALQGLINEMTREGW